MFINLGIIDREFLNQIRTQINFSNVDIIILFKTGKMAWMLFTIFKLFLIKVQYNTTNMTQKLVFWIGFCIILYVGTVKYV